MRNAAALAVLLLAIVPASGQTAAKSPPVPDKEATGNITGHVLCSDTNLPARLASVFLQPVYEDLPAKPKSDTEPPASRPVTVSQTLLDGSFFIGGVKPGRYYVLVEAPGYLSPVSQLTREQLNKPDDASSALISRLLAAVTVTANHTATADVRLFRGGTISGSVRFDDVSPNAGSHMALLRRDKDGKWDRLHTGVVLDSFNSSSSDDEGRYRISGLPAGEYLVRATINIRELTLNGVFGEQNGWSYRDAYELNVYSGGAVRTKDAKPIKIQEGETVDLVDIEIPVSKMHSVSGSVVDPSGAPVNAATVSIVYADDNTKLVSTEIDKGDSAFHLLFVPEGEYKLKVSGAKEVSREEIMNDPGTMPPSYTKETMIREYTDAQQPISIRGEMSGVIATVKPRDVKLTSSTVQ